MTADGSSLTTIERISYLKEVPFLAALPDGELDRLALSLQEETIPQGGVVLEEGTCGEKMYFVVRGGLEVQDTGGQIATLTEKQFIGERQLLYDEPYLSTVIALENVHLLSLRRSDLERAIPVLALNMMKALQQKTDALEEVNQQFQEIQAKEMEQARSMQMALTPQQSPSIAGFDLAGRCVPAGYVGGDFFQYFHRPQGRLAFVLADVPGHGMGTVIPVLLFNAILKAEMQYGHSLEELFSRLNKTLCETLDRHFFVSFIMGELDPANRTLQLSNCGCPYPYHYISLFR